ncbi:MAG: hypothetical protein M1813_000074 [Trichoglossum hirsutum]|nr:MAG: hypothetical protein M1813_000074 [Trichoglossum hirsutum]
MASRTTQQGLAPAQILLLCGLRLIQQSLYRRHSSRASPSMHDLANRGINTWVHAHSVATDGNSSFWDETAAYLQDHTMFYEDQNGITGNDLRLEFDAVLKRLPEMPLGERLVSSRFSGQQRLVIVCIGYDINVVEPALPPDLWSSWDDEELDELVTLLSNSAIFQPGKISHDFVRTWLGALGRLFAT